ncbi:MAG TPA: DNA polymerase Y family protein, partial [Roseomonas sp.]
APLVAPDPPDGLLVNIAGTAGLHGGEEAIIRRAVAAMARLGHAASASVARSAVAAMALARCGIPAPVPAGEEAAALAPLPIDALRLGAEAMAGLRRLGLYRIGDVLAQPRAPLARRFGAGLSLMLDRATGATSEPFRSIRPARDRTVTLDFEEPLITRAAIDIAAEQLLARLCARLAEEGQGLRRLCLRACRADGGVQELAIGLRLASRDPRHLSRLLAPRLEELAPGFGFDRIALLAERTEPLAALQPGLAGEDERAALAALLNRLTQRMPVWRLHPCASHWPERSVERADPLSEEPVPEGWAARSRPLLLLRQPERLEAMAVLPDDPPFRIRWRGTWVQVHAAEGPERLEPEWWRDRPTRPRRDYYRLELVDGRRLWVCHAGAPGEGAWFLHGLLP